MNSHEWNYELEALKNEVCPTSIAAKVEHISSDAENAKEEAERLLNIREVFIIKAENRLEFLHNNSVHTYVLHFERRTSDAGTFIVNKVCDMVSAPTENRETNCGIIQSATFSGREYRDAVNHAISLLAFNVNAEKPITSVTGDMAMIVRLRRHAFAKAEPYLGMVDDSIAKACRASASWKTEQFQEAFREKAMDFSPIAARLQREPDADKP